MEIAERPARATPALSTYSQIGSRGLPWTSVRPLHPAHRERGEPVARRRRDRRRGPSIAAARLRVEPVDLGAAGRRGVVVAADAERADRDQPLDDRVRLRAVADDVAEMPDGIDRADVRRGPRRGRRGCCGCPRATAIRTAVNLAARRSPRPPRCAPRDPAGRPAGTAPARGHNDEPMADQARHVDRADARATRRRARRCARSAGRQLGVEVAALPGDEDAARREERERELDEVGEAGHGARGHARPAAAMGRVGGEGLGADRAPPRPAPAEPGRPAATAVSRKRAFLPSARRAGPARAGSATASGRPG